MTVDQNLAVEIALDEARQGRCEWFLSLAWGPLLNEDELLAGHEGQYIDPFGLDMINSAMNPRIRKVWVKGNTGCGKNHAAAKWAVIFFTAWPDAKLLVTRDTYDQAKIKAWGEIDKWLNRSQVKPRGKITASGIADGTQHFIATTNPGTDEGFSGAHTEGGHVAAWLDEATAVRTSVFKMLDTQIQKSVMTFNPRTAGGPTRQAFPRGKDADKTQTINGPFGQERLITIGGPDLANVRLKRLELPIVPAGGIEIDGVEYGEGHHLTTEQFDRVKRLVPGQTCYDKWLGIMASPDENFQRTFGLGQFPKEDAERQVCVESWLRRAYDFHYRYTKALHKARGEQRPGDYNWKRPKRVSVAALNRLKRLFPITAVGVDVAGSVTGDETAAAIGGRYGVLELHTERIVDTVDIADWIEQLVEDAGGDRDRIVLAIDGTGIGHGLVSVMKKRRWHTMSCLGSHAAEFKQHQNARVERVMLLGNRLNPKHADGVLPFMLPRDDMLEEEFLVYEKFKLADGETWSVTPKRDKEITIQDGDTKRQITSVEAQLSRSPDRHDAVGFMFQASGKTRPNIKDWMR